MDKNYLQEKNMALFDVFKYKDMPKIRFRGKIKLNVDF